MRFLGTLSTILVLIAVVFAVVLTTDRANIPLGDFLIMVWPVAVGVTILSILILLFASGSAKLLRRIDEALHRDDKSPVEGTGKGAGKGGDTPGSTGS